LRIADSRACAHLPRPLPRFIAVRLSFMSHPAAAESAESGAISEAELQRAMRRNVVAGVLGMIWISVALGMPLPLLMQAVHASGFQLGLLSAAWFFAMLAQVPSALLVERMRRRKPFWAAVSIVHRLLWAVPALLPWCLPERRDLWPVVIIASIAASNVLGQAGTGPWQSWMADLLPPDRAGRFWGMRHRFLSLSMVIAALAFGAILDRWSTPPHEFLGFQIVFGLGAVFGVADIVVHCFVAEPAPVQAVERERPLQRVMAPLRDRDFRRLTIAMGIWTGAQAMLGYTMGLPGFFAMVHVKEAFGATYGQAAWIFIAAAIGAVLWTPRIGRWIDAWGGRRVMLLLVGSGPLFMLAWLLVSGARWTLPGLAAGPVPQAVIVMSVVSLVTGGLYAASWLCQVRLTQEHTTPAGRTIAMGVHWSLVGLIGAIGPLLAGVIKDALADRVFPPLFPGGAPISYFHLLAVLHALVAWLVVVPMVRRISEPPAPQGS
jgi:MFS family permease